MNIDNLFDNRQVKRRSNPRTYDVRITLNKSGAKGFVVRFGFLNEAVEAFKGKAFIQVSKVEVFPDRIYFKLFEDRANLDAHKLCSNSKSETSNLYTTILPSSEAEKIYRAKWINKTFNIQFDDECEHYYIAQEEN